MFSIFEEEHLQLCRFLFTLIYDVLSHPEPYFRLICRRRCCDVIAVLKLLESGDGSSAMPLLIIHTVKSVTLNISKPGSA